MSNARQTTYEVTSQHQGSIMLLHQYISCNSDKYLFLMGSYESVLDPLVWKTSHFRNVAVKRISALVSGGGTANHLTGSPVTN